MINDKSAILAIRKEAIWAIRARENLPEFPLQ